MHTTITSLAAHEHAADPRKHAERRRLASAESSTAPRSPRAPSVELRLATADDGQAVERLAALDDAPALDGQILLALHDRQAVAAVSLDDGRVVADPFVITRDAVAMLRLRAAQLSGRSSRWERRTSLRLNAA
jgi:hypothetical protein